MVRDPEILAAKPLAVDAEKLEKVCVREDSQLAELTLQGKTAIKVFGDHNHLDVPQIEGRCRCQRRHVLLF